MAFCAIGKKFVCGFLICGGHRLPQKRFKIMFARRARILRFTGNTIKRLLQMYFLTDRFIYNSSCMKADTSSLLAFMPKKIKSTILSIFIHICLHNNFTYNELYYTNYIYIYIYIYVDYNQRIVHIAQSCCVTYGTYRVQTLNTWNIYSEASDIVTRTNKTLTYLNDCMARVSYGRMFSVFNVHICTQDHYDVCHAVSTHTHTCVHDPL